MSGTRWDDTAARKAIDEAFCDALFDAGGFLGEEANRTVPIEEGPLTGSMTVSEDRPEKVVQVGYDTPYAVVQHEDLSFRHDPGRRAKWLELTFAEQSPRVQGFVADRVRRAVP